jgi:hypothetical protein
MEYFTKEFVIQEIQEYIPFDIYNLFNTKKNEQFNEFKKLYIYIKLNQRYSLEYCSNDIYIRNKGFEEISTGMTFRDYINSQHKNINKRLSININNETIQNVMNMCDIHTLNLINCSFEDVGDLGNIHTLNLTGSRSGYEMYGSYEEDYTPIQRRRRILTSGRGLHFKGVKFLGNVYSLNLSSTDMSDEEDIKHLGNCHTLDISKCDKITDKCIKHLGKVHTLNLSGCNEITDEGIKHLINVHTLNLSGCNKITDAGIKDLINVHTLNLSGCNKITDAGIKHLINIHTLNISGCNKTTDNGIKYITNIHTLEIDGCNIPTCAITLGNIKSLIINDSKNIKNKDLQYLGGCHTIDLSNGVNITGEGIKFLSKVKNLNLSRCKIMNEDLRHLGNCHTLNLSYCCKITDEGLKYLTNLHTINLFGCNDVTDKGLMLLANCNTIYVDASFTKNITEKCIKKMGNIFIQVIEQLDRSILIPGSGNSYTDKKTDFVKYNEIDYTKCIKLKSVVYNNTEQFVYQTWEF